MTVRAADGTLVGNQYDKYGTRNPVARLLMRGFLRAVRQLYDRVRADEVLEAGCGEGRLADHLMRRGAHTPRRFEACDLRLALATDLHPALRFREASIYELPFSDGSFDLALACEVLEHLDDPARGLRELVRVSRAFVLVSVPREPLFRGLNLLRGRYLARLGSTPGHLQHFSSREFVQLVAAQAEVVAVRSPPPWTVVLARRRAGG